MADGIANQKDANVSLLNKVDSAGDHPRDEQKQGRFSEPITSSHEPTVSTTSSTLAPAVDTQSGPMERPLNVTDALSYLDSVKMKFSEKPEVYNNFLDIMKDFKSQLIDTPGVIERVSNLFHGHPALIQGFNTFLPAGYRIECTTDAQNPNFITVTTPLGTTTQATNGAFTFGPTPAPNRAQLSRGENESQPAQMVPDVNLEPALTFVQRVKTRYANEPEKYRRFLDTLNPNSGGMSETRDLEQWAVASLSAGYPQGEVIQRMGKLFADAPALMRGFVEFLPDKHAKEAELARLNEIQETRKVSTPAGEVKGSKKKGENSSAAGAAAGPGSSVPQKRKRKPAERERERDKEKEREKDKESVSSKAGPSKAKKPRPSHTNGSEVPSPALTSRHPAAPSSPRRPVNSHIQPHVHQHQPPPPLPPPIQVVPALPPQPLSPVDETQFFDRVKRALDNGETYNEFLKLINLFTQDIIDTARLVRESRSFLGDGELMAQFREILGWDEQRDRVAVAEDIWTRPMAALDRPSRNQLNIRYGSYRKLPESEANVLCSGRDDMCKSVLNDEWISQPTFASEDTGFFTHRKNIYEEALHRSEEERHEYDFHIEAIYRTISMLEPLNNKIAQLNMEERNNFKLKPNLGGAGKSIHLRVLKKIYGREVGQEVFQTMQDMPAHAIPVVLARLKEKHEEWKRAQREWNKVWREVDARNYHKSLDYQGITFKTMDKKAITVKTFVNQIEAARDEQMAKRASLIDPLFARTRPRHQLEFVVDDIATMQDALKLTLSFLDRTQGQINLAERKKIETFLRAFVPTFFVQDPAIFNGVFVPHHETFDSDVEIETLADESEANGSSSARSGRNGRKGAVGVSSGDLRKKLLKNEQAKSSRRTRAQGTGSPSLSRRTSPTASDTMAVDEDERQAEQTGSNCSAPDSQPNGNKRPTRRRYSFFTNTTFYVCFRLLELLYSRLLFFKNFVATTANDLNPSHRPNPILVDLGVLNDMNRLGDRAASASHLYSLLLESCERLFDNDLEQHAFEDQLRWMFGPKEAYRMFTVDKVVGAIVKQTQNLLLDVKSQELFDFLLKEREIASPTTQDLINARRNTERTIGPDENLFRMDWLPESRTVTIQLLGKDDSSFDDSEVLTGRWQAYIQSFVHDENTIGLVRSSTLRRPFLRRTHIAPVPDAPLDAIARSGLEVKVCVRTYRLFFVSRTEDFLLRNLNKEEHDLAQKRLRVKDARRRKWLEKFSASSQTIESLKDKDEAEKTSPRPPPAAAQQTEAEVATTASRAEEQSNPSS